MSFIDGLFLTLVNTVACLALPKLLSVMSVAKTKRTVLTKADLAAKETSSGVTTLPQLS